MRQATGDVSLMCGASGQYTPIHSTVIHDILTSTARLCPHATKRHVKMLLNFKRGLKRALRIYRTSKEGLGYTVQRENFVRCNASGVLGVCPCFPCDSLSSPFLRILAVYQWGMTMNRTTVLIEVV